MLGEQGGRRRHELVDVVPVDLGEQVLAGGEVPVEGALADACLRAIAMSFTSPASAMAVRAAAMIRARLPAASARRRVGFIVLLPGGWLSGHVSGNLGLNGHMSTLPGRETR